MKNPQTTYALFLHGKQLTKAHSTHRAVIIEAYEKNIVVRTTGDFGNEETYHWLPQGYEIKEVA